MHAGWEQGKVLNHDVHMGLDYMNWKFDINTSDGLTLER
jgi:hypothetical protein